MSLFTKCMWMGVAALGVVGAAGCVSYEDQPLSAEDRLDSYMARTLDSHELGVYVHQVMASDAWPPGQWDLPHLTLAAFFYNPELAVARARWAVTEASVSSASQRPNPTLSLGPGYNTTTGKSGDVSPWIVGMALDVPLDTARRRGVRAAQATWLSEAARLEIASTAWAVRHQVHEAFLTLYAETQLTQTLHREWQLNGDKVRFLTHAYEAGEVSGLTLSQARIERARSHTAWLKSGQDRSLAVARLAEAVGLPAESFEGIQFDFQAFETEVPSEVPTAEIQRQALLNRADLLAALAEYQASQFALQQQIVRQYPEIQIGPGYEFDQGDDKWSLGLSVTLPVFNQNQAEIRVAEAAREEAAAIFQAMQAQVIAQITQAVTQYRASVEVLRSSEGLARDMAVQMERVETMVQVGESLAVDRLDKALEYSAAQTARLEARIQVHKALSQIEDVMQIASDLSEGSQKGLAMLTTHQGETAHE